MKAKVMKVRLECEHGELRLHSFDADPDNEWDDGKICPGGREVVAVEIPWCYKHNRPMTWGRDSQFCDLTPTVTNSRTTDECRLEVDPTHYRIEQP